MTTDPEWLDVMLEVCDMLLEMLRLLCGEIVNVY